MMPNSLLSSTKFGTQTPPNASMMPTKGLTTKHKQLAKAIKQHHHTMVRQTDGNGFVQGPMSTKTVSKTNYNGQNGNESDLRGEQHQFINATMSPKNFTGKLKNHSQTMSPPNQSKFVG